MKCIKCNKKATIFLKTFHSCNKCFFDIIEKRIRKEIRETNLHDIIENSVYIINDGSLNSIFSINFFNNFFKTKSKKQKIIEIKIIKIKKFILKKTKNNKKISLITYLDYLIKESIKEIKKTSKNFNKETKIIILPWNLNQESNLFIESIFYNKPIKKIFNIKNNIFLKPLIHLSNEEISLYLKLKNLNKKIVNTTNYILSDLTKDYPEINFSILKSIKELEKETIKKQKYF